MEFWWVQPSSHDQSVHMHSRMMSVNGTSILVDGCWLEFQEMKALMGILEEF